MSSSTNFTRSIPPRKFNQACIISSRYTWYGWIAGLVWASAVFLHGWFDPKGLLAYVTSGMIGLCLGFLYYIFNHRYRILFHFNTRYPDAFERLEKYLSVRRQRWDNLYLIRFGIMLILGLTMLLLLFFFKESKWSGITAVAFISLVLAFIIKGWLDFHDEILLHDIRRSMRDQTSE
jgi:hypothetical protein